MIQVKPKHSSTQKTFIMKKLLTKIQEDGDYYLGVTLIALMICALFMLFKSGACALIELINKR